jgi:hypothetical protein
MSDVSRGSLFEDVAVTSGVSGAIDEGMRRGSGVYVREGPRRVAVWNVPTCMRKSRLNGNALCGGCLAQSWDAVLGCCGRESTV